jgi:hypothetical protein
MHRAMIGPMAVIQLQIKTRSIISPTAFRFYPPFVQKQRMKVALHSRTRQRIQLCRVFKLWGGAAVHETIYN